MKSLSSRERQVLKLISDGCSNKQIAFQLDITEQTVKTQVSIILMKMGANNRAHAITIAKDAGIV